MPFKTIGALLSAITVALVGGGSAAVAADFTGPRVEVHGGWDQMKFDLNDVGVAAKQKADGFNYGGSIGYDYQASPSIILGIEASLDDTTADHRDSGTTLYTNLDARRDLSASARIGTLISPNAMVYAKVGYTNLQVRTDALLDGGTTTADRRDLNGVRVGAGAEVAITPRTYVKTEYDYSNYEKGVTRNTLLTGIGFRF